MYVSANRDGQQLDTRSVDRSKLRLRLLGTWKEALVKGYLPPGVALRREDRVAAIEQLSVLACIGLRQDTLQVKLEEFNNLLKTDDNDQPLPIAQQLPIIQEADERLADAGHPSFDVRLAATWGTQLQLVEAQKNAVRFPHSILQAYLGSRLIGYAMADAEFRDDGTKEGWTGAAYRAGDALQGQGWTAQAGAASNRRTSAAAARRLNRQICAHCCVTAAGRRHDAKALDLYATVLEIDSVDRDPQHRAIAEEVAKQLAKAGGAGSSDAGACQT